MKYKKQIKLLALSLMLASGSSANSAPWQIKEKKFVLFEQGKIIARSSNQGIITYHYENGRLAEVRRPSKLSQYRYKKDKLDRIIHSDGSVDVAIYTDNKLTGFERSHDKKIVPAKKMRGADAVSPDEPVFETMGMACQLTPEGEIDFCEEWPDDGGGGSAGGGGSYIPDPGDAGGTPGGGTPGGGGQSYFDPDPPTLIDGKTPAQIICEAGIMRSYYTFAAGCAREPTPQRAEACHRANTILMKDGLLECKDTFGPK